MLQIASSGYRRHAARLRTPETRCVRARRDGVLTPEIERASHANDQVSGADKVWHQLEREGVTLARCTVERLMRRQGLRSVRRGKVVRTRVSDSKALCPTSTIDGCSRPMVLYALPSGPTSISTTTSGYTRL